MKKTLSIFGLIFFLINCIAFGQEVPSTQIHKNGAEVNILFPIFPGNAINAKYTRTLWQKDNLKGDILIGFNIDLPRNRETEGKFSDYSLSTGYRQYFWKGLFAEFYQTTGFGNLKKHVSTSKDYASFDWLVAGTAGYKINLGKSKKIYSIFQVGMANVFYKSNPWPIFEDNTLQKEVGEQPFFYGGVQLGINF
jgi:hypothetical protein